MGGIDEQIQRRGRSDGGIKYLSSRKNKDIRRKQELDEVRNRKRERGRERERERERGREREEREVREIKRKWLKDTTKKRVWIRFEGLFIFGIGKCRGKKNVFCLEISAYDKDGFFFFFFWGGGGGGVRGGFNEVRDRDRMVKE